MRSRRVFVLVTILVVCLVLSKAGDAVDFNDGGTHDVNITFNDDVWVDYESPGVGTIFNLLSGGSITGNLVGYEDGYINISGGTLSGDLLAWDNCQVSFSNGSVGAGISGNDNSQIFFSSEATANQLWANGSSQVILSGGSIVYDLIPNFFSQVTISGGSIGNDLWTLRNSQTTITGGTVGGNIVLQHSSRIEFIGTDFAIDGIPFGYGEYNANSISGNYGTLTGTLVNGDSLDNKLIFYDDSSIILIPEPATLLLLGLGVPMLSGLRRKG